MALHSFGEAGCSRRGRTARSLLVSTIYPSSKPGKNRFTRHVVLNTSSPETFVSALPQCRLSRSRRPIDLILGLTAGNLQALRTQLPRQAVRAVARGGIHIRGHPSVWQFLAPAIPRGITRQHHSTTPTMLLHIHISGAYKYRATRSGRLSHKSRPHHRLRPVLLRPPPPDYPPGNPTPSAQFPAGSFRSTSIIISQRGTASHPRP